MCIEISKVYSTTNMEYLKYSTCLQNIGCGDDDDDNDDADGACEYGFF